MKIYRMNRVADETGTSGAGIVAEVVEFGDKTVVVRWLGVNPSTTIYRDIEAVRAIHGHGGLTRLDLVHDTEVGKEKTVRVRGGNSIVQDVNDGDFFGEVTFD